VTPPAAARHSCPQGAEPSRLWSLWDMLPFVAPQIINALVEMEWRATQLHQITKGSGDPNDKTCQELRLILADAVAELEAALKDVPLSPELEDQKLRLRRAVDNEDIGFARPEILAFSFRFSFIAAMTPRLFFMIGGGDIRLYVDPVGWFEDGKPVLARFKDPQTREHIEAAGRCCAVNEWTSAVFHSMCVLERGLLNMARRTRVPLPSKQKWDRVDWEQLLHLLQKRMDELRQKATTEARKKQISRLSDASAQFASFRDAWRNHTMHGRKIYVEGEARPILNAVRAFMRGLS
jgi:hypothetical protein